MNDSDEKAFSDWSHEMTLRICAWGLLLLVIALIFGA